MFRSIKLAKIYNVMNQRIPSGNCLVTTWKHSIAFFAVLISIHFPVWISLASFVLGHPDILIAGTRSMSIGDLSGIPKSKSNVYAGLSGLRSCTRTEDLKFYIIMEINVSLNIIHLKVIKHLTRTCMYHVQLNRIQSLCKGKCLSSWFIIYARCLHDTL